MLGAGEIEQASHPLFIWVKPWQASAAEARAVSGMARHTAANSRALAIAIARRPVRRPAHTPIVRRQDRIAKTSLTGPEGNVKRT